MITTFFLSLIVGVVNVLFSWLPPVTTLPNIGTYDIDTALVQGAGYTETFVHYIWPIQDVFYGMLVLMTYYGIKMLLKIFLGHRAPGTH